MYEVQFDHVPGHPDESFECDTLEDAVEVLAGEGITTCEYDLRVGVGSISRAAEFDHPSGGAIRALEAL